ncbi:MAG TPA: YgaP-like transmembrane domain [Flavipsychrobacter sp.]|nr:YgaP-like transmembrane domain [Flavipsychrobacter sp.]
MKNFFRFMASQVGRGLRSIIGFAIMAWGYSTYRLPLNVVLIGVGLLILLLSLFDICLLAPIFGYSIRGRKIIQKYKPQNAIPGEERQ